MDDPGPPLQPRYDAIVVGAGPAGISFVRTLINRGSRARILLIDKDRHPRDKVCGDALTYVSVPLVRQIFPELSAVIPSQSFTRRYRFYFPNGKFIAGEDGQLDMMPRREFDHLLFRSICDKGIDILQGSPVTALLFESGRVAGVRAQRNGSAIEIAADLVVGADGSAGVVRNLARGKLTRSGGVAVRQYFREIPETNDGLIFLVDPAFKNGYLWIFPFSSDGRRWANVGYFAHTGTRLDMKRRYREMLRAPVARRYLGDAAPQGQPVGFPLNLTGTRKLSVKLDGPPWGPGYLLLGDAAGLVHPFSGEGIAAALFSGQLAATLFDGGHAEQERGARYESAILEFARAHYSIPELFTVLHAPSIVPWPLRGLLMRFLPWWAKRHGSPGRARDLAAAS